MIWFFLILAWPGAVATIFVPGLIDASYLSGEWFIAIAYAVFFPFIAYAYVMNND